MVRIMTIVIDINDKDDGYDENNESHGHGMMVLMTEMAMMLRNLNWVI